MNATLWKTPVGGESGKQDAWLKQTLETAAKRRFPTLSVGHCPLFLEKPDEPEPSKSLPPATRTELLNRFERHNGVAVLAGHAHCLIINDDCGSQLAKGETTSKTFDRHRFVSRLRHIGDSGLYRHESFALHAS